MLQIYPASIKKEILPELFILQKDGRPIMSFPRQGASYRNAETPVLIGHQRAIIP